MSLSAGTRLGPYEIQSPIGAGGMGEVYKARDTRLNRTVAIKVLPPEVSDDPERRARFEREAKTVASLSHPHICTLHDVGDHDGALFLVMELLAGDTLAARLEKGPVPLEQALVIGAEIAEALAAAHRQGVIHRDLKPGNVMLTKSGAKLLDFGVAKAKAHGEQAAAVQMLTAASTRAPLTAQGVIVGTLQYMAPEQVEGKPTDARTDLWALGLILYEMLTGKRAFEGTSAASLIGNIMNAEPAPLTLQPVAPPGVDRIVRTCLAKQPDHRWDSAHDLADELRWVRENSATTGQLAASGAGRGRRWMSVVAVILGAVSLIAIGISTGTRLTQHPAIAPVPGVFKLSQVTDQRGRERFPSLSPDGKSVVYASRSMGNWDIYLQRVDGRNPVNLTKNSLDDDSQPAFSPDGKLIAFRSERDGGGIFVMGATGESVLRLTDAGHNPAWSPDSSEVAYATEGVSGPDSRWTTSQIWAVNVLSRNKRLISPGDAVQPNWSPNGQRIAYWRLNNGGLRDIATVPARGGTATAVTDDTAMDWDPVWSPDGRHLYFSSNRGGSMNVWRVPIDESSGRVLGAFEPVTTPSLYSADLSFSHDGTLLAYSDRISGEELRRLGLDAASGTGIGEALPMAVPTPAFDPSPSRDGNWLAFVSGRNQDDIFVVRTDGTDLRQLTDDPYRDLGARWSPDGKQLLFFSNRNRGFQAWTINADGSGRKQLTEAADGMWYPVWRPDGKRVAAFDSRARTTLVFDPTLPWNEQSPQLLPAINEIGGRFLAWSWSPDGRLLAGTELTPEGRQRGLFAVLVHGRAIPGVDRRCWLRGVAAGQPPARVPYRGQAESVRQPVQKGQRSPLGGAAAAWQAPFRLS